MSGATFGVGVSRRGFLATGGALIVSFSLLPATPLRAQQGADSPPPVGSLGHTPMLDAWIRVDADGGVSVFTGKVELGQGIKTALIQIAAEQIGIEPSRLELVTADTARTPDEGFTSGSHSMQDSGTAIMHAAAQVREILLARAALRLDLAPERLRAEGGMVVADDGRRVGFGALVTEELTRVHAQPHSKLKDPRTYTVMGHPLPRVDLPAKVSGGPAYVQDLRLPGMVHARIVRPPSYAAQLREVAIDGVQKLPGVIKVVRDGSYLAVVAEREYQAVVAMRALAAAATWDERPSLAAASPIDAFLRRAPSRTLIDLDRHSSANPGLRTLAASYRRPYQLHGAIGPSCAVGWLKDGSLTVWTHSQGVYPLRKAIAEMLSMPVERVRCVHVEGAGCYGHNGADDAAADAALLARALPERPVRVQWMREQEHTWEPYGPAMLTEAKAALDAGGNIVAWEYDVWSNTHSTRPGTAGSLMPAWHLAQPFAPPEPQPIPLPEGGGDRNALPLYVLPNARVVHHFVPAMPVRVSALRALGAYMNVFSIESFIDELARAAGADPVEFRLRHLDDPRAREVITMVAQRFGWAGYAQAQDRGKGLAFARYKNLGAYLALAVEVEVLRGSGQTRLVRAVAAVDSGQAVNPDGIRNQIEGGIVQASSWTLREAVRFDATRITSSDWSSYPILRFPEMPDSVVVHVIDRPGQPFLGTGEAAQGPTAAALANAVADATGVRLRELPFTPERVKAALGA
ncbi:MAG TPA: molybdopterin cofactor-binding domain-containing protein [Casimicrobiaceae bacterium]|jgi:CO/xanthine dehydrogenase Mo-binding subunit|nr:molybdopterin cofactor-binding domain-containing protein [Casimicrobiaceae bacterium]